ncbi:cytochrome P450 [Lujinxingia litoralis]|uniref:Cytochrome P450 n=1 Tax=Lujinxingia litoralis TaxID=2211119 RepID=A0A328C9U0_9DELT|nr:cytochrome P450 [Lujinxingia litoralis]RAL23754.1 cytochrome P450 [Lujinxingia litoralis]
MSMPSTTSCSRRSPGPRGLAIAPTLVDFVRGPIPMLRGLQRRYGEAVRFRFAGSAFWLFSDPALIEEVMLRKAECFIKDELTHELDELLGQGLLTSEGELWRHQRRLAAPTLKRRHIQGYADAMVGFTRAMIARWGERVDLDFHRESMELTLRIVVKTLFNLEMDHEIERIDRAFGDAMDAFHQRAHTPWRFVMDYVDPPLTSLNKSAVRTLNEVIGALIRERQQEKEQGDDLLWRLIVARDEEGRAMDDQQLRDEALTIFLAGHETTALAITYALYLLANHPGAQQRVHDELDAFGDEFGSDAVARLPYLKAVANEALRLYPPAWIVGREAARDVQIGPWKLKKGEQVVASPLMMHRHPAYFEEPDRFVPSRWAGDLEKRLPRFVYFPFGGGPRICIGNHFAMMELVLVLAVILRAYRVEDLSETRQRLAPSVTLRPKGEVPLRFVRRG